MRSISELRGLRFPDDYVVKMFFKEGLQNAAGRVLELGCGSGNNLLLFAAYGWQVTGVDISSDSLADARHNLGEAAVLLEHDLSVGFPALEPGSFHAVLLPSINYYVPRASFVRILQHCRHVIRCGGMFYIRSRLPEDWRWGRGREEELGGFRLNCRETGELGLLNVFYAADDLMALIQEHLGVLDGVQQLRSVCDNPQGGVVVRNADHVIWGRASGP